MVNAVKTQADSIKVLKDGKETTDLVLGQVGEKLEATSKTFYSLRAKLNSLEKSNEEIKNFLARSVPTDISGMLNNARTRTNDVTNSSGIIVKETIRFGESTP